MNFVTESNAFHSSIKENELHTSEVALWYCLFHLWNQASWVKWFPVANDQLTFDGKSTTVPTVHHARNVLKQKGFIDFKTQGRNKKTWYNVTILFDGQDADYSIENEPDGDNPLKESLRQLLKLPLKQSLRLSLNQMITIYKQKTENNKHNQLNSNSALAREEKLNQPIPMKVGGLGSNWKQEL